MKTLVEVTFTPADFAALANRNLDRACCVVFDVLRATSSMVTALHQGAVAVLPVGEISAALEVRRRRPEVLLAGERDGFRIGPELTGGIPFDLGNSPREFTAEKVAGRTIVMTTTNGTRALRSAAGATVVLAGSFLNLQATADFVSALDGDELILVCSGTLEEAAYEDVLGAGALCDLLWSRFSPRALADSARMARKLYHLARPDLGKALAESRNGTRLLGRPELQDDVAACARIDGAPVVCRLNRQGEVTRAGAPSASGSR